MKRLGSSLAAPQTDKAQLDSSLAMVNIVLLLIFFFIASGSLLASREVTEQLPLTSQLSLDACRSLCLRLRQMDRCYWTVYPFPRVNWRRQRLTRRFCMFWPTVTATRSRCLKHLRLKT